MPSHVVRLVALLCLGTALPAPRIPAAAAAAAAQRVQQDVRRRGHPLSVWPRATWLRHPGFLLSCNDTAGGARKPFRGTVEVLNISLQRGQLRVMNFISSNCYLPEAGGKMNQDDWRWDLADTPYAFSDPANKFTVVGCRTLAYIGEQRSTQASAAYMTGCVAMWHSDSAASLQMPAGADGTGTNGSSCSGMGCCQTAVPTGLWYYQVWFDDRLNTTDESACGCSYAALMDSTNFTFSTSYLTSDERGDGDFNATNHGRVPLLLDWVVGNGTCEAAHTSPGYVCVSNHSLCVDSASGHGYICNCDKGYHGNPYLTGPDGCQDIDECKDNITYSCHGNCTNQPGTHDCFCPPGTQGNATIGECHKESPLDLRAQLAIGISAAILVAVIAVLATKVVLHKRSMKRQAHFQQHGGQLLKHMLKVDGNDTFTIYDKGNIEKATRNFHKGNIVGEGAHGTVYKATLWFSGAATIVAVKRCKEIDESRKKEFVQELVILCHLSHPNIVRLLGCCLEFEAPMLVYEFVQNRSLNHLLHGKPARRPVTLAIRLKIAAEVAEALAHLHSPPHPVLHGDVKPENILLADGWVAKVSDFGCSTINDNVQVVPKGTLAYLDPEFLRDFQITEKTDVYSFGVVLVELLTRRKPQSKEGKNPTLVFQEAMEGGTLDELLDTDIVGERSIVVVIQQAAELASRCLAAGAEPGTKLADVIFMPLMSCPLNI